MELVATGLGTGTTERSGESHLRIEMHGETKIIAFFIADTTDYEGLFINEIMTLNIDKYQP